MFDKANISHKIGLTLFAFLGCFATLENLMRHICCPRKFQRVIAKTRDSFRAMIRKILQFEPERLLKRLRAFKRVRLSECEPI